MIKLGLRIKPPCERPLFFTSLSTAEAHIFGVKFIGLYGTVCILAIWDFSFGGESDLCSEGGATVSNNSPKRPQNGFKIGTSDEFVTHLR